MYCAEKGKFSLKPFSKGLWGCGGDAPAVLVAFGKRRRVEKASCGRLFVGNPRRGFPDRAGGSAWITASPPETRPKRPPPFGGSDGGVSKVRCHRARSRGYLLRSMRPARCTFPSAAPFQGQGRETLLTCRFGQALNGLLRRPAPRALQTFEKV